MTKGDLTNIRNSMIPKYNVAKKLAAEKAAEEAVAACANAGETPQSGELRPELHGAPPS